MTNILGKREGCGDDMCLGRGLRGRADVSVQGGKKRAILGWELELNVG